MAAAAAFFGMTSLTTALTRVLFDIAIWAGNIGLYETD